MSPIFGYSYTEYKNIGYIRYSHGSTRRWSPAWFLASWVQPWLWLVVSCPGSSGCGRGGYLPTDGSTEWTNYVSLWVAFLRLPREPVTGPLQPSHRVPADRSRLIPCHKAVGRHPTRGLDSKVSIACRDILFCGSRCS